jgi:hypothetical protein
MNNNINEIQKHRDEILKDYQISFTPTIKSALALLFSGLISTFGIYSILQGMINDDNLQIALGVFVIILAVADTVKRSSLAKYYNSIIRKNITQNGKVLKMNLFIAFVALLFMVVFDFVGSFATAEYVKNKYSESRTTDSKEFELLEANAESGKDDVGLYKIELAQWNKDKAEKKVSCSEEFKGWKAKYKAKCKNEWEAQNPKPATATTVSISDYTNLKETANADFLSRNIFNIILFLSLALTMLLQYTTVSEIKDNFDSINETLTPMVLGILQDRLSELETNMIEHETLRNKVISDGDKVEKTELRKFEKLGKAIGLMTLNKAVESRGKTVQRIANNTYKNENMKAGHIDLSSNKNTSTITEDELRNTLLDGLKSGDKLLSKTSVIDVNNRGEKKIYEDLMHQLDKVEKIVIFKKGSGYFLK